MRLEDMYEWRLRDSICKKMLTCTAVIRLEVVLFEDELVVYVLDVG